MKKSFYILFLLCIVLPTAIYAQNDDSKYLVGAVPEVDGKVVFSKEFNIPGATREQVYNRALEWLKTRMAANNNQSRVVFEDPEKGQMAATAQEYLVFRSSALSLDRALLDYQVTVTAKPANCLIEIERVRYNYQEDEKFTAEEWITDANALNKTKTKLVRGFAKFRTKTVDFAEDLFDNAQTAFGLTKVAPIVQQPIQTTPVVTTPVASVKPDVTAIPGATKTTAAAGDALSGYKRIDPEKIPGNIIKMLNEDWMLITAGNDQKFNMMTASWGGLGMLYGKPVMTCYINPARYTYQLMEKGDTYTLTFYTEAYRDALKYCGSNSGKDADKVKGSGLTPITTPNGSKAFGEAWLIIECRKLVSQSISYDAIQDEKVKEQWAGKPLHKMYIGEILNVWVK